MLRRQIHQTTLGSKVVRAHQIRGGALTIHGIPIGGTVIPVGGTTILGGRHRG